ncbi:cellulase family glycosylhydrolase [Aquimarina sp. U1-2]|uniref:cellulase family glycosylhydrolase n=1 Tax=Aquimarina sp. U1-2 TaxID=2823141 RepID=UPI001AECDF53|nr:cellulase family glycosylhydrolase [Aquimarina sp. U1-2]MBP2833013.1 cellulase family glycosylhydrolase [Aquimarina sp. U1-2]
MIPKNTLFSTVTLLFLFFFVSNNTLVRAQNTPVAQNGQLKVCGTKLCNQYDQPIQLRGMSTHGIQWYGWGNCLTESSLDALAYDWDADILRISLYVQEGGYETDPVGYTNQVSRLIDEATERGMYALVDWHQLNPGDPNVNLENAKRFFTDIANLHKDKNNIIYDVCNEPNGVGVNWNRIKNYADQIIPVIQRIDNDAVVLVGTQGWATFGVSGEGSLQDVIDNPLRFDNVMYTFHVYAKSHRDAYLNTLDSASDLLPVFVTEFGSQEYTGDGPNDFVMTQQFIDLMRRKKISWTSWNYSDDFRSGAAWNTGTCASGFWTVDQLKEAGKWIRNKIKFPTDDFPGGDDGTTQTPYSGNAIPIPGKIETEHYDLGGENIAFYDITGTNEGGSYRNDKVDIEPCSEGGYNIGWIKSGEWLEYTVNVAESKTYTLESRVASISSGGKFHIEIEGQNVSGSINVPNTRGWQNWQTVSTSIPLTQGKQILRIVMDSDDFNLNHLVFKDDSTSVNQSPVVTLTTPQEGSTYFLGQTVTITANASDSDGTINKVEFYANGTKIAEDSSFPFETTWVATIGNHIISAKVIDDDNATALSAEVGIIMKSDNGNSCNVNRYVENGGYSAGSEVENLGNLYECKPWPFSGWCNGIADAYAPGTGTNWEDAWILKGDCNPDGNEEPMVSIVSPSSGQTFVEKSNITIDASATDSNGSITKVEFFSNGTKVGEDTTAPYTFIINEILVGNYTFTAKATDNSNLSTISSPVTIRVTGDGGDTDPLPARIMNGYWHNFQNGSGLIPLREVSSSWDVINVSFAEPRISSTDGDMAFELSSDFDAIGYTEHAFRSDLQWLQSQGKKVIISIGGAEGQVRLTTTSARDKFISSMIQIIEDYGFDGMDIDFEGQSLSFKLGDTDFRNPTTPLIVNTIDAIRNVCNHFGEDFILTMAPETFFVQLGYSFYGGISEGADRRAGAYLPVIHALRDKLTFLQVQYYNSGPITALDNTFYTMGNPDFYVSLVDMLLKGFPITKDPSKFFPPLRPDQVLIGVPATVNAGNGHTGPDGVVTALDYIINGNSFGGRYQLSTTYPSLRGVMSWSINWDKFENLQFSNTVRAYLDGLGLRSSLIAKDDEIAIKAYPNPAFDFIHLSNKNDHEPFVILNNKGQTVLKGLYDQTAIDVSSLEKGMYFFKGLHTGIIRKIVKQ